MIFIAALIRITVGTSSCFVNNNTRLTFSTSPSLYLGCTNTKRGPLLVGDFKSVRWFHKSLPWGFNCLVFPTLFFFTMRPVLTYHSAPFLLTCGLYTHCVFKFLSEILISAEVHKDKGKVVLVHVMKVYRGSSCIAPLILNLGIRSRWGVNIMPRSLDTGERSTVPTE